MDLPAPSRRTAEHRWLVVVSLMGLAGMVAAGLWLEPDPRGYGTHEKLGFAPCFPMEHWGIPCPGCGVTTAVTLATRGRLLQSLRTQPFGFLLAVVLPAFFVWILVGHARGRDRWEDLRRLPRPWLRRAGTLALALLVLAWLYKIQATGRA